MLPDMLSVPPSRQGSCLSISNDDSVFPKASVPLPVGTFAGEARFVGVNRFSPVKDRDLLGNMPFNLCSALKWWSDKENLQRP